MLLWDVHKLQKPVGRFIESHSEDVTAVRFNQEAPQVFITCSIDNVMNMWDLNNHTGAPKLSEDDLIDGAYSST